MEEAGEGVDLAEEVVAAVDLAVLAEADQVAEAPAGAGRELGAIGD